MRKTRIVVYCLSMMAGAFLVSGCGARFITAKTLEVTNATGLNPSNDPVALVRYPDNLPADQQVKAQELRDMSIEFFADREKDLNIYGDLDGSFTLFMFAVSAYPSSSTYPEPVEFAIYTSSPHTKGQKTQDGYAEIRFGGAEPVFTTDRPSDTFFEFEVSDIYMEEGKWIASGTFSMIAKNKNDNTDTRRLFVMDGAFITKIKNH